MIDDPHDRRLALRAVGLLAEFNRADVLSAADVHVATRLGTLLEVDADDVLLAAALAVRAVRNGSVCVDLATVSELPSEDGVELTWPEPTGWTDRVAASPFVAESVLRLDEGRLYLDRYWREEGEVCADLLGRLHRPAPTVDEKLLGAALARVFPAEGYDEQRSVARAAAGRWVTVLTGGPGTGKTTTVAGLLALVSEQHEAEHGRPPRIAMCAPTAKASARLQEAVAEATARLSPVDQDRLGAIPATTLHRLLGWRPGSGVRFRHDRNDRLPHDIVVVDETSMVSLTHMTRLLEAMRPTSRLVLVGDADQLSSIEAGAVLADIVRGLMSHPAAPVSRLSTTHRFGQQIGALAEALRTGDADAAIELVRAGHGEIELIDPDDVSAMTAFRQQLRDAALRVRAPAVDADAAAAVAALDDHRLLCAHREGRHGVNGWNREVERLVSEVTGIVHYQEWYAGRPVLVTANDYVLGVYNGDIGVTILRPDGRLSVALSGGDGFRELATTRLPEVQTVHAMTVHKSQGSQAKVVSIVMPPPESRLLTRELFYTAVTRAEDKVRIVGTETAIRDAIGRPVQRASGLAERLSTSGPSGG
ncbi:MAG: exodeoxyribonuclease V subunit alpha [Aeromicrobium sp.]